VSWAPSCGRLYNLVATCGRDGHERIWKIKPGVDDLDEVMMGVESEDKWTAVLVVSADFDQHK